MQRFAIEMYLSKKATDMEKKTSAKRFLLRMISGLLVLLGFSACTNDDGPMDMYGTPTTEYQLKGKVTDAETGTGIPGIRMVFVEHPEYPGIPSDTVYTASDGGYDYASRRIDYLAEVIFEDVDGPENGVYPTTKQTVKFSQKDYKRVGDWHTKVEKSDLDFALAPEKSPE